MATLPSSVYASLSLPLIATIRVTYSLNPRPSAI
jgi:hypothetical protein